MQLAEKLNYSDKAVSKWERGESLPDLSVLVRIAEMYQVSLDYLISEHTKPPRIASKKNHRRIVVALCATGLVWLVAVIAFSLLYMFGLNEEKIWLCFLYAIPVSFILLIVFSSLWWNRFTTFAFVSGLLWTLALALFLTIVGIDGWLFFIVAVPLQVLAVFWFLLRPRKSK